MDLLAHEAITKLAGFNPQNLANFIWAYARHVLTITAVLLLMHEPLLRNWPRYLLCIVQELPGVTHAALAGS